MVLTGSLSQANAVGDIMTRGVVTVTRSDSLLKARDLMIQSRFSQLVVVDHRRRPIGFISKRDLARFLLEDSTNRGLGEMTVSEAATKSVSAIRQDLTVHNVARSFDADNLAYAVITNEDPLIGIVTETDLCRYYSQNSPERFKVSDFMQGDFIFAKSTYPVVHVAVAIIFRQLSLPVIDEELVGILTLSDLLSLKERLPATKGPLRSKSEQDTALIRTKDVMTRNPITVREDSDLAHAAEVMVKERIGSLPVTDGGSRVAGLLTQHEVVRALGAIGSSILVEAKGN